MHKSFPVNRVETNLGGMPSDGAPEEVEAAWQAVEALTDELGPITEERKAVEKAIPARVVGGERILDPSRTPEGREAYDRLPQLQRRENEKLAQIDEAGDAWALAVDAAKADWIVAERQREAAEIAAFHEAIKQARAALGRLGEARGVIGWLEGFELVRGPGGCLVAELESKYRGPWRERVDIGSLSRNDNPTVATKVLDVLKQVA